MSNLKKRKLAKRLIATLLSVLSCVAVMAVGVYAASVSFSFQVSNQISLNLLHVDGDLLGRRGGDVIYGLKSMGDEGFRNAGTTYEEMNATTSGFISLYGNDGIGYKENENNMTEIEKPVNFYKQNTKESLTMYYVFKFTLADGTPTNVNITLTNNSTQLKSTDSRKDMLSMSYKYSFSQNEPADWTTSGTSFGVDGGGSSSIKVLKETASTHAVYIYASMTVKQTDTLATAYTLGFDEDFHWKFSLNLTGEFAE